jgi:hypothetical protein
LATFCSTSGPGYSKRRGSIGPLPAFSNQIAQSSLELSCAVVAAAVERKPMWPQEEEDVMLKESQWVTRKTSLPEVSAAVSSCAT